MNRPQQALLLGSVSLLLACALPGARPREPQEASIQLVETAPIETEIDSADLVETFEAWQSMIGAADSTIELAHFYASNDPDDDPGEKGGRLEQVILALQEAAKRGVRVRFLADAGFYKTYAKTLDRLGATDGIDVRLFDLRSQTGGVLHAKYMIVDDTEVYLGSANFDWRALEHIQELGVRVRSAPVALAIGDTFELDWTLAGGEPREHAPAPRATSDDLPASVSFDGESVLVRPVVSPKGLLPQEELWDLPQLIEWIDAAQKSVRVQLLTYRAASRGAYFGELESALRRAAARRVQVKLLVADWGKRRGTIEGLKSLAVLPNVEVRMATLPQASRGFIPFARVIHSKYMVVDDNRAWVGTSNWSHDYFYKSRNVGVLVEGKSFAGRLNAYFDRGWAGPYAYPVDPAAEYELPRIGE